jgi:hypothetical protein
VAEELGGQEAPAGEADAGKVDAGEADAGEVVPDRADEPAPGAGAQPTSPVAGRARL